MEKLKIAIVCTYYPWPPSLGGVENIVRQISIELAKKKHEVNVICSPYDPTTMRQVSSYGIEKIDGITVHKLRPQILRVGYARSLKGLKDIIQKIHPEIVHSSNLHPHLFSLIKQKESSNYKLVAQLHHPAVTVDNTLGRMIFPFVFWSLSLKKEFIDVFIAHTELERTWLINNGIDLRKIQKITFPCIHKELLTRTSTFQNQRDILFIGRIVPVKGLHILIPAMTKIIRKFKDARLIIAGPREENYYNYLKNLVAHLNLQDHIIFRNPVFDGDKWNLISNSTLLVLPSLKEYTPNVVVEAQALGKPIVATKVGALSEMVINKETGIIVEPNKPSCISDAIITILGDENLKRRMSINAKLLSENYLIENNIDKLEKTYYKLLT